MQKKKIFEVLHRNLHAEFEVQLDLVSKHVAAETKSSFRIHPTSVRKLRRMIYTLQEKWESSHRTKEKFLINNEKWLNTTVIKILVSMIKFYRYYD